jgi:hypothetical protein
MNAGVMWVAFLFSVLTSLAHGVGSELRRYRYFLSGCPIAHPSSFILHPSSSRCPSLILFANLSLTILLVIVMSHAYEMGGAALAVRCSRVPPCGLRILDHPGHTNLTLPLTRSPATRTPPHAHRLPAHKPKHQTPNTKHQTAIDKQQSTINNQQTANSVTHCPPHHGVGERASGARGARGARPGRRGPEEEDGFDGDGGWEL